MKRFRGYGDNLFGSAKSSSFKDGAAFVHCGVF